MFSPQIAVEYLQRIYPDYDIYCGYIGNVERWGDERSHRIWVSDVYVEDVWGSQPLHINLGSTEDLNTRTNKEWVELLMRAVLYIERMAQKEINA